MAAEETHGLGYERVDDDPNVAVLFATIHAHDGLREIDSSDET